MSHKTNNQSKFNVARMFLRKKSNLAKTFHGLLSIHETFLQ